MAVKQTLNLMIRSVGETESVGGAVGGLLKCGDCVGLIGALGAGKTQFVRGLVGGLGAEEELVASPTFVLMHEYPGPTPVVHLDAYRLSDPADLETVGWSAELIAGAVTVVEWADRIAAHLPADYLQICLDHEDESSRVVAISGIGVWAERMGEVEAALDRVGISAAVGTGQACPSCGVAVDGDAETYPFCSPRCRLVDLHHWFNDGYRVSRPAEEDDLYDEGLGTEG